MTFGTKGKTIANTSRSRPPGTPRVTASEQQALVDLSAISDVQTLKQLVIDGVVERPGRNASTLRIVELGGYMLKVFGDGVEVILTPNCR